MNIADQFRSPARQFAQQVLGPRARELDEKELMDPFIIQSLKNYGYTSMMYPEKFGGSEADLASACVIVEELAKVCASTAISLVGHLTGSEAFLLSASDEQKEKYLLPTNEQSHLFAICISEPEAGSDVTSIKTSAKSDSAGYVLNGSKRFVTNGGLADLYIVIARTNAADRKGGLSAFIVPKETIGLEVGKKEKKMGLRGSATTDLYFNDAWVSKDQLLGNEGDGFATIMKTMNRTRVIVAAFALGIASAALEYAMSYSSERAQFGRKINEFQGLQFMLADMVIQEESSRAMVYYAAEQVMKNNPDSTYYSSIAKTLASDTAMAVTGQAVQILGGAGYMRDYPVERMMRDAKVTQIFEGTNQIQRMIITKQKMAKIT